jgi:RNA polymerase sigma-70 factor, ECF subfamily
MLSQEQTTSLLLRNQLALTAFFASVVRSYHLAEDIFQEICIGALRKKEAFESDEHLLNWARLAGKNQAIDILRARNGKFEGLTSSAISELLNSKIATVYQAITRIHKALGECVQKKLTSPIGGSDEC